jgi:hypothetical protein
MAGRSERVVGVLGTALVALVLTHSLVFLARYGSAYGEALAHNGHDLGWSLAVWSAAILGMVLALAGAVRLVVLAREAHKTARAAGETGQSRAGTPTLASLRAAPLAGTWLLASARLAVVTAVLLTIQEHLERAGAGLPQPGIGLIVSPEYPWAVAIIALVSLAVGFVVALYRWRRDVLLARIRAARAVHHRTTTASRPSTPEHRPAVSILGRAGGLRAPPLALPS